MTQEKKADIPLGSFWLVLSLYMYFAVYTEMAKYVPVIHIVYWVFVLFGARLAMIHCIKTFFPSTDSE